MRIGVDVMGGDNAPDAILAGSLDAVKLLSPEDTLVLIGDEAIIREGLHERGLDKPGRAAPAIEIERTTQVIAMDEPPVTALRTKPESSIVRMGWLGGHRSGNQRCEVIISEKIEVGS